MGEVAKVQTGEVQDYSGGLLEVIARAARDPNVDIDKMERLLAMQERVMERNAKVAFTEALKTMQPLLPVITERGKIIIRDKNDQKKIIQETSFARWEDINEAIRPLLNAHGFSLSFRTGMAPDGKVSVTAVLAHDAGHQEETTIHLPHDSSGSKNSVQAIGSSTSYGKRYTTMSLLNITSRGEDDDGYAAVTNTIVEDVRAKASDAPFPQGPCKNKTELKAVARDFWRDVEACDDLDQFDALEASQKDLIKQLRAALPSWWSGGEREGEKFEGLGEVMARCRTALQAAQY